MADTNVQLVLNSRDRTAGTYNSSLYNAKGQNIIQGNIKQITVSEVNFPYDIPNIQAGYNSFALEVYQTEDPNQMFVITIVPGFYTGTELATAINDAIDVAANEAVPPILLTDVPVVSYGPSANTFYITPPESPSSPDFQSWVFNSSYTFPVKNEVLNPTVSLGKDIFSIMGYLPSQSQPFDLTHGGLLVNPVTAPIYSGQSAPLVFTQYVDICSPQLCKNQYMSDGSTTNLARRSDVICRLFVCDNVSITTAEVDGSRPFIINRQYYNARMMKWTVGAAVGTVDINLYDDVGQPLTTTWQPRPFQITFNCHESIRDEGFR